jgi:hypothetical protein
MQAFSAATETDCIRAEARKKPARHRQSNARTKAQNRERFDGRCREPIHERGGDISCRGYSTSGSLEIGTKRSCPGPLGFMNWRWAL